MNTFALLATADHLQAPKPDRVGGHEILNRGYVRQEPSHTVMMAGSEGGAIQALSQTVGIRLACSTVVRWYHGGINE
ncbi:MAG: hypothetical protein ACO1TE_05780 [Prosthecobacter sp.]